MTPLLKITGLKKSYKSPDGQINPVIDIESFELAAAREVALIGKSGTGKSTFLNIICGILKPDSGNVLIKDTSMSLLNESAKDRFRARHIGYIFQTFNLLQNFTALENIMIGMHFAGKVDKKKAIEILKKVGLADRMDYKPAHLSTGQQQRVAVARALVNQPELVIADEPTGNLDPEHAATAISLIRELCQENNAGLLVVSHDKELINSFDRVDDLAKINNIEISS
ncbi:MAG: ABC transporter ATP-binding protein [Lentisphaeraceae bacterium]|nr:ABC transporter ATP-binding protein [Lentisphaeraceae bacterium]